MVNEYISPNYEPIGLIRAFHACPRFGNTHHITEIFTSDGGIDKNDLISYIRGTIFIAGFLLATYLIFVMILIIVKCCCKGNDKVRILAGKPFLENEGSPFRVPTTTIRKTCYWAILLSSLIIISSGIVFLTQGIMNIRQVAMDVRDGTNGFIELSAKVTSTADSFISFSSEDVAPLRDSLVDLIDGGICQSLRRTHPDLVGEFDEAAGQLVAVLNQLQGFSINEVADIKDTFTSNLQSIPENVEYYTTKYEERIDPAHYATPTITFGCLFMIGIVLAWSSVNIKIYILTQTWIIMPLFFIFISLTVILTVGVGSALVANSDICIGNDNQTPEGFIKAVAEPYLNEGATAALDFYVTSGCTTEYTQLITVKNLLAQLLEATANAKELQTIFMNNKSDYETLCNEPLDNLQVAFVLAIDAFQEMSEIGLNTVGLLDCEDINQIYVDVMHDAVCTSAPLVLGWLFSSMIAIYIGGILIICLRGAFLPTESNDEILPILVQDKRLIAHGDDRTPELVKMDCVDLSEEVPDKVELSSETEVGEVPDEVELSSISSSISSSESSSEPPSESSSESSSEREVGEVLDKAESSSEREVGECSDKVDLSNETKVGDVPEELESSSEMEVGEVADEVDSSFETKVGEYSDEIHSPQNRNQEEDQRVEI